MASAEGSNKKMIILKSSDGEEFEVEEVVIMVSQTIRNMIKDNLTENDVLPLDVNSKILSKVMEYCNKHVQIKPMTYAIAGEAGASDIVAPVTPAEDLKNWDADFVRVDRDTLFDVIRAAHYLNIKELLDLTCQTVADMIKGKTPEEMREIFNIKNDYTPEEEENFRRENQWAF